MYIRIIFLCLFGLSSFFLFGQKPGLNWPAGEAGKDYNVVDSNKKKQGLWIRVYPNNNLYYKGQFTNNIPVGKFEFYYETGELMSEVDHIQDTTINDVVNYYQTGRTRMSEGRYIGAKVDGKFTRLKEGTWRLYMADGTLSGEENYQQGVLHGNAVYYFPNGKKAKTLSYKNGKMHGPFVEYYDDGLKKIEGSYEEGELSGAFASYFPGGQIETKGQYANGQQDGLWMYFLQNGRLESNVKYRKGTETGRRYENGTFMEYYPSGIPKSDYTYEDGKKNGPFSEWYDVGEFIKIPTTPEEAAGGVMYRQKLEGTQLSIKGEYLDDKLEGEIFYYSQDGKLVKKETWEDGKLKKTE